MLSSFPSWRRDLSAGLVPQVDIPERFNMTTALLDRHIAAGNGQRTAIVGDAGPLNYAELLALVNRAGQALLSLGVQREERVMLLLPDGPEFLAVFLGAMRIGATPVPVNTLSGADDYAYHLNDSRAAVLVVDAGLWQGIQAVRSRSPFLHHVVVLGDAPPGTLSLSGLLQTSSPELDAAPTHADDAAYWLYSSGTTGRPKGVIHRHQDMVHCTAAYAGHVLSMSPDDRTYSASRLFFSYGLVNSLYLPLLTGASVVLTSGRPDPRSVLNAIAQHRPTVFFGVPSFYAALLKELETTGEAVDLTSVRLAVSAGEALPGALYHRWRAGTGVELLDGIGSTEFGYIFISNTSGQVRPGSSGTVIPPHQARIVDEHGLNAPVGELGELWVKGESTAAGYWNKREQTRRTFWGEWLRTGDRYSRDADGYFWFHGRADDMLRVNGQWVSPLEIEAALLEHPDVLECAVIGSPDEYGLEKPKAFVVLRDGAAPVSELLAALQTRLPSLKVPRWIQPVPALPKTPTGKVQRFLLRTESA